MSLAGKVAVVTGAAQGIGRAYVLALAKAGATVVASSRSMGTLPADGSAPPPGTLAETVRTARDQRLRVEGLLCDVGDESQIERLAREVIGNHGRIDIIINNAATYPGGQADPNFDPLSYSKEYWDLYFRVNVMGPYFLMRHLAPYMIAGKSGSIVNVTSHAGTQSTFGNADHHGMLGYAVSKAALNRMSLYFSEELRQHGIAVNILDPGSVMTGAWRAVPEEMKKAAVDSGRVKAATEEVMGSHIVFLARQTAETMTGRHVKADEFGKTWPNS